MFDERLSNDIARLALNRQIADRQRRNRTLRIDLDQARSRTRMAEEETRRVTERYSSETAHKTALLRKLSDLLQAPAAYSLRTLLGIHHECEVEGAILDILRKRHDSLSPGEAQAAELDAVSNELDAAQHTLFNMRLQVSQLEERLRVVSSDSSSPDLRTL